MQLFGKLQVIKRLMVMSVCAVVWEAAGNQSGDSRPAGGTHQGAAGAGADPHGAHQGTQAQVSWLFVGRVREQDAKQTHAVIWLWIQCTIAAVNRLQMNASVAVTGCLSLSDSSEVTQCG